MSINVADTVLCHYIIIVSSYHKSILLYMCILVVLDFHIIALYDIMFLCTSRLPSFAPGPCDMRGSTNQDAAGLLSTAITKMPERSLKWDPASFILFISGVANSKVRCPSQLDRPTLSKNANPDSGSPDRPTLPDLL